ncbi:AT-rich interactive domain-containing protein 5B [Hippocampus zosterae]|uniref:AT-rich interactive domain-containing protein 5B n=1 Tax=Hippocampus zosterae TaxID=109293 RepID=UPI00223D9DBF|nr:AT-rich interactive domain-containing protein 5B [Hippocampus zosterae]XP_051936569.1 AT-rich interactive domain-containing protein 5B [Hippocampus zosterae]
MEPNSLKWVGSSCGLHGPYIFYKAFKFTSRDAEARILSLGDFFLVRCKPDEPVCVAELQLLWEERTSRQLLSSSKLYFLPEDTPQGRGVSHGEHEVIAVSEKVIVRLRDLVKWTLPDFSGWAHGLKAEPLQASALRQLGTNGRREALHRYRRSTLTSGLNFKDVQRERANLGQEEDGGKVLVLSYPQYCRYRSVLLRLRGQPGSLLLDRTVLALGGVAAPGADTRVLYCRDTFEHPALLRNESVCDRFAPNLKGRPRKKKLSGSQRRDSAARAPLAARDANGPETKSSSKASCRTLSSAPKNKAGGKEKDAAEDSFSSTASPEEEEEEEEEDDEEEDEEEAEEAAEAAEAAASSCEESREDEQAFLVELYKFMKKRDTPIERIPFLGFKQINLWTMFQAAQKLGGYELITARRQWKHVYDELGGNPSSTSAATCTRRHYERLLLPYERHLRGEQDKPLPPAKPRSQEKAPSAKKAKGKRAARKERGEAAGGRPPSQDPAAKGEAAGEPEALAAEEAVVVREEELHLTLRKEESYGGRTPGRKEGGPGEAPPAPRPLVVALWPEWRRMGGETEAAQSSYVAPPESESRGGRACKRDRRSPDWSADPSAGKDDHGAIRTQMAADRKVARGVMSPLAKKKLLSQACESASFTVAASLARPALALAPERDADAGEREARWRHESDGVPEAAPVMSRPSVIRHAQSSRPPPAAVAERSGGRVLQPHVGAPWQPYLPRTQESASEKLLRARGFAGDRYSSLHLHGLYRQTENCQLSAYADEAGRGFVGPEREGQSGEDQDQPRDLTLSKRLCRQALACGLPYPKACRVPPVSISPPVAAGESSPEPSPPGPVRPGKRSLGEAGGGGEPAERKVRAVAPLHPAPAVRRGDPEELQAAEPARAAHLTDGCLPGGHPAGAYPPPRAAPLYAGMYPPGGPLSRDGLGRHPGLQYLKSQSAASPLVPPLAFHSALLHGQLLASAAGPHHFFRHPGGAALYGDLLHHLYPLSTLPPPQLSSVHPSTRL